MKNIINSFLNGHKGYSLLALKGLVWVGGLRIFMRSLTLFRIAILARILSPDQFGVYAIISFALSFTEILTETGINVFLVQSEKALKKYIDTAWILSIIRGFIISIFIILAAPLIAGFFDTPEALRLIQLSSLIPILRGFINPSIIAFQKEMKFNKEFNFRSALFLIETLVAIGLSILTRSESALIWSLIVGSALEVIVSFLFVKPIPKLKLNKRYVKEIIHSGKWVTLAGITNYLFHNADDIIVGKLLGTYSLGLYQMGYKIAIFPITEVSDVISRVSFPVFTKISSDRLRLRSAFIKTLLMTCLISIGFGIVLILFTEKIVTTLLGEKWIEIVPFLKILTLFGIVRGISGSSSALFLSVKKQKYVSVVTMLSFLLLITLIFPLVIMFQLIGASISALVAAVLVSPVMVYYSYKVLYEKK